MWPRRLVTLSTLALATAVLLLAAPLLIVASLVLSFTRRYRSLPHALAFAYTFLFYEWSGVLRLSWVWVRYRNSALWLDKNYEVQRWWAGALLGAGKRIFRLRIEVTGEDAIFGPSAILICRHASIGDNVLPLLFFGVPRDEPLRYILKQELKMLPTLDIGAHRLPCLFVDRSGADSEGAVASVKALVSTATDTESIMVYPEGTRFSPEKQARLAQKPELAEQVQRWPSLLPPRLGGVQGMLDVNPGKDVAFLCHSGFEGSANLEDLMNGGWLDQLVRIHFWRVPYAEVPDDKAQFVFDQWDVMQQEVERLRAMP